MYETEAQMLCERLEDFNVISSVNVTNYDWAIDNYNYIPDEHSTGCLVEIIGDNFEQLFHLQRAMALWCIDCEMGTIPLVAARETA